MRRTPTLGLALVLLALLVAPARSQGRRILIPVEEFLPAEAVVHLTVPDGRTAMKVLARAGEDEAALAKRLSALAGGKADVAPVLRALADAAAGPVSVTIVPERLPRQPPRTAVLVSFASLERNDRLMQAVGEAVRTVLAPAFFEEVREEEIMSLPVFHFVGESAELYLAEVRGYVLLSTSPFLLGRVLREVQSPSVKTLKYDPAFEAARAGTETADGFLFIRPAAFPDGFGVLGAKWASGVWMDDGEGVRDELRLKPSEDGLLADVAGGRPVPGGWSEQRGGLWLGLSLDPQGVAELALAVLPDELSAAAAMLGDAALGPVELLWGSRAGARLRMPLKEGQELPGQPFGFGPRAKFADGALVLAETIPGLAGAPAAGERTFEASVGELAAPLPVLLAALGLPSPETDRSVRWQIVAGEGLLVVRTGRLETGPFAAIASALAR